MVEPFFDGNALALVKNGIVQDFFADFNSLENDLVGSIFIGEVDRISKDLNSSFIKLPFNKMGFLKAGVYHTIINRSKANFKSCSYAIRIRSCLLTGISNSFFIGNASCGK